ncbi:MAG TPA: DUF4255 domain-containing protein [Flavisolibacter sp.]|jgi:hypothetical protein
MIDKALAMLRDELDNYIDLSIGSAEVVVDNIGLLETSSADTLTKRIVITLVNLEEESTLKNSTPLRKNFGYNAVYENPPVFLNLYVLITCNYSGDDYVHALERLSAIIKFFQSRNSFSYNSLSGGMLPTEPDIIDLKFTMELYTLTFEQINHLWGSLGGRQIPFVMYKLRLVALTERAVVREIPVIEEIDTKLSPI